MSNIKEDLLNHLKKEIPDLHISLAWVNKEKIFPCITIFQVTESREFASEEAWLRVPLLQFDAWSKSSMLEVDTMIDRLEEALKSFKHPVEFYDKRDLSGENVFRTMLQLNIKNYIGAVD